MSDELKINLQMDDAKLKALVSEAIFQTLDASTRDRLIKEALASLMAPEQFGGSDRKISILQRIFADAVRHHATRIVEEYLTGDSRITEGVKALIADAWARLMSPANRETIVQRAADALAKGFLGERY